MTSQPDPVRLSPTEENQPAEGQFLIAHKARGELAFDVGHKVNDFWISTTYGHRLYPIWLHPLDTLLAGDITIGTLQLSKLLPEATEHFQVKPQVETKTISKPKAQTQAQVQVLLNSLDLDDL